MDCLNVFLNLMLKYSFIKALSIMLTFLLIVCIIKFMGHEREKYAILFVPIILFHLFTIWWPVYCLITFFIVAKLIIDH